MLVYFAEWGISNSCNMQNIRCGKIHAELSILCRIKIALVVLVHQNHTWKQHFYRLKLVSIQCNVCNERKKVHNKDSWRNGQKNTRIAIVAPTALHMLPALRWLDHFLCLHVHSTFIQSPINIGPPCSCSTKGTFFFSARLFLPG